AKSLAIGNPADGYYSLRIIKESGGTAEAVEDHEVVEGIMLLARTEGIFAETAGGVTVGVLKKLAAAGRVDPDERIVVYVTGNGRANGTRERGWVVMEVSGEEEEIERALEWARSTGVRVDPLERDVVAG